MDGFGVPWKTVVGVVADTANDGLRNSALPEIYLPMTAGPVIGGGITSDHGVNIAVRSEGDPELAASLLRDHLRAIDPGLLARVRPMDEQWRDLKAVPRFHTAVFSTFAGLGFAMAGIGVYGVLAHVAVLRRAEIGIRMALGARPVDVQRLIFREALILALAGIAVGVAITLPALRLLDSVLDRRKAPDPLMLGAVAALLILLALTAGLAPARRAAQQDPAHTLRAE